MTTYEQINKIMNEILNKETSEVNLEDVLRLLNKNLHKLESGDYPKDNFFSLDNKGWISEVYHIDYEGSIFERLFQLDLTKSIKEQEDETLKELLELIK